MSVCWELGCEGNHRGYAELEAPQCSDLDTEKDKGGM